MIVDPEIMDLTSVEYEWLDGPDWLCPLPAVIPEVKVIRLTRNGTFSRLPRNATVTKRKKLRPGNPLIPDPNQNRKVACS